MAIIISHWGKCTLKLQRDTTLHPLEWLSLKLLSITCEDVEKSETLIYCRGECKMVSPLWTDTLVPP